MARLPDQTGRHIVVTGANSGTGKEAVRRLAAAGASVVMAVRSLDKGAAAREEILRETPDASLELRQLDLADLANVHAFADGLIEEDRPIDVLVNNAGVMIPPSRLLTKDGFELQFGTNFIGPFALTNLLLPLVLRGESPRVATMASTAANFGSIRFRDLQWSSGYSAARAYAQSKLADLLLGLHLARVATERGWDLRSTIAHPGYTRTNLQTAGRNLGRSEPIEPKNRAYPWTQSVEQGTEPLLWAAVGPGAVNGGYTGPSRLFGLVGPASAAPIPRAARGVDLAASVWSVAESLTATSLPRA
jgi:NAD(P)-dependent dehydrogenase (short-subunit alcohol dehydrogenase family)